MIVLNHFQTKALIDGGKAFGQGKLVGGAHAFGSAYARGTMYNGMSAHGDSTTVVSGNGNFLTSTTPTSGNSGASTAAVNANTDALNANTGSTDNNTNQSSESTQKTETALDKFKKWLERFYDWIEVLVERTEHEIEKLTTEAELLVGYQKKNANIDQAMKLTRGLIKDEEAGQKRYEAQATKVRNRAVSSGVLSASEADKLVALIKSGKIDIAEYKEQQKNSGSSDSSDSSSSSDTENPKIEFINSYKEWYDKAKEMETSVLGLRQSLIDLEQTKLDNIATQFEDLAGYADAVKSASESLLELNTRKGKSVAGSAALKQYNIQFASAKDEVKQYKKELSALKKEMKTAGKVFGKNSNQYVEAQQKYQEVRQSYYEAQMAYRDVMTNRLSDIQDYYGVIQDLSQSYGDYTQSQIDLSKQQGVSVLSKKTQERYSAEYTYQNQVVKSLTKEVDVYAKALKDAKKKFGKNSRDYKQALTDYNNIRQQKIEEELKLRELEVQRLSDIEEQFQDKIGVSESASNVASSKRDYYTSAGKAVNSEAMRQTYRTQMAQQATVTKYYKNEISAYQTEMNRAAKLYGKGSKEYQDAVKALNEMKSAYYDSKKTENDLKKALLDLNLTAKSYQIDFKKAVVDLLSAVASLKEKRGVRATEPGSGVRESDYASQIAANKEIIKLTNDRIELARAELKTLNPEVDSDRYHELQQTIASDEQAVYSLLSANEDLKASIRTLRWKPFEDASRDIELTISDYNHLRQLMNEESFFDEDGKGNNLTQNGINNLALLGASIQQNTKKIALYRKGLKNLEKEYKNGNISEQEYIDTSRQYVEVIQSAALATKDDKEAILELYRTQIKNEVAMLQESIEKRKTALQKKKEYYDYDKTIRSKSKDINALKAQISALEGVSNMAGQAELARLRQQLSEQEDDFNDTVYNHRIDTQLAGYDKLSKDVQENLDDTLQHLAANADEQEKVVNEMLRNVKGKYDETYKSINKLISDTGTAIGETAIKGLGDLKTSIPGAMDDMQTQIQTWLKTNAKGFSINVTPITTGAEPDEYEKLKGDSNAAAKEVKETLTGKSSGGNNTTTPQKSATEQKKENDQKAATTVSNLIKGLKVTDSKSAYVAKSQIADARKKYNALTADQKKLVSSSLLSNLSKYEAWANEYTLVANMEKKAASTQQALSDNVNWDAKAPDKDKVKAIIKKGAKRSSKTLTDAEKKAHHALWEHIASKYGYNPTYAVYGELAKLYGLKVANYNKLTSAEKTKLLNLMKADGYAKGTLGVKEDELNWTHDGELIRTRDGAILRQLPQGTQVLPQMESINLMKWAQFDPSKWYSEIDMTGKSLAVNNNNQTQNITYHYDSLLTVNGNVDKDALPELQEILEQSYQYTSKKLTRETRKLGIR